MYLKDLGSIRLKECFIFRDSYEMIGSVQDEQRSAKFLLSPDVLIRMR